MRERLGRCCVDLYYGIALSRRSLLWLATTRIAGNWFEIRHPKSSLLSSRSGGELKWLRPERLRKRLSKQSQGAIRHNTDPVSHGENPEITMTETRFYEPARLSTLRPKPLFSLKLLDANLVEVIVIWGLPVNLTQDILEGGVFLKAKSTESSQYGTYTPSLLSLQQ